MRVKARPFPDFIIIGAMRAGTTALAERLSLHPEIAMSRLKETDFFVAEKNFDRGLAWYLSLFPAGDFLRGEASPNYSKNDAFPGVPQRIRRACPNIRLIYMVRDPVDRFWSHYAHSQLMYGGLPSPTDILSDPEGKHILASSMYHRQLSEYLEFFPPERIHIVDLSQFKNDDQATMKAILSFIGARPDERLPRRTSNSTESLSRVPQWLLGLSQQAPFSGVRAGIPSAFRRGLRRAISRPVDRGRTLPSISESVRKSVTDALVEDAAKFRSVTGRAFSAWSI